jgi:hypothetical protein
MKHSRVRGTKMFPMMTKKQKAKMPFRKQKHKKCDF